MDQTYLLIAKTLTLPMDQQINELFVSAALEMATAGLQGQRFGLSSLVRAWNFHFCHIIFLLYFSEHEHVQDHSE